jgi:hypothetical protein
MATTDTETMITPRMAIREIILEGMSEELDDNAVRALEDVCLSATEAAFRNSEPLLDFDEFSEVAL